MGDLKEALNIDVPTLIISILVIIGALKVVVELVKWFINQFGIEFKHVRKKNEEHDLLVKTIGRVDELEIVQKHSVEEFREYDSALKKDIEKISGAIDKLFKKIDCMEEKSDATERASLKDRIATLYRKYSVDKSWTKMERESFNGLIRDYEAHGGKNSFVHDICEPESFTWEVTDEDDDGVDKKQSNSTQPQITRIDWDKR